MKLIPILVITNALALALAIYLFVEQSALRAHVGVPRAEGTRTEIVDSGDLQARVDRLERTYAARGEVPAPPEGPAPEEAAKTRDAAESPDQPFASPGAEGAATAGEAAAGEYEPHEFEAFRKKVRKANQVNEEEDQLHRVAERLDALVSANRIAPLDAAQRMAIARLSLDYRRKAPEIMRQVNESGAGASRDELGRQIRAGFEALRAQAQRDMEQIVSAADAKTIMDESMRDRSFGGGGPVGPPRGFGR